MKFTLEKLLQEEKPTNRWLVKDKNKEIIRAQSINIDTNNLNNDDINCMNRLIDFVRYSQEEDINRKDSGDYLRPAVGLAAPQIGVNKNIFYINVRYMDDSEEGKEIAAINGEIIAKSVQLCCIRSGEGCLSVDGDRKGAVPRHYKIEVKYYDFLKKQNVQEQLKGYEAIVFQHELDHINGKLYYDHINKKDPSFIDENWLTI